MKFSVQWLLLCCLLIFCSSNGFCENALKSPESGKEAKAGKIMKAAEGAKTKRAVAESPKADEAEKALTEANAQRDLASSAKDNAASVANDAAVAARAGNAEKAAEAAEQARIYAIRSDSAAHLAGLAANDAIKAARESLDSGEHRSSLAQKYSTLAVEAARISLLYAETANKAAEDARADADATQDSLAAACSVEGEKWFSEIMKVEGESRSPRVFLFTPDGTPCYVKPSYFGVAGETINVGVIGRNISRPLSISFDPCSKESATPSVLISDKSAMQPIKDFKTADAEPAYIPYKFPPRQCFNENVIVTIKEGPSVLQSFPIDQYERYRATMHVAAIFSPIHDTKFGIRNDNGQNMVFSEGPTGRGPEYVAALVIYGLPHYIEAMAPGKPAYRGRDVVNEKGWMDNLGGVVGVGLNDPGKRFVAGLSYEILAGVNLLLVDEFAQVSKLVGINEGEALPAGATAPSTQKHWEQKVVLGVSLDLRYVTSLFSRR